MSAYNYIVIDDACPVCQHRGSIKAQAHVAASFDGDAKGRFCGAEYRIGETMRWWARDDPRYSGWKAMGRIYPFEHDDVDEEACLGTCSNCRSVLVVLIHFEAVTPTKVMLVATENEWPEGYLR